VKKYNTNIKSINSDQKELDSLKEKNDEESEIKKEELINKIKEKEMGAKKYISDLEGGIIASTIVESIRNVEVRNPENAVRDNLQLVGYVGKELNKVTAQGAMRHTQSLLNLKFRNNDIRNEYSKRNLNYFDSLRNDSGVVGPVGPGVPRSV
jgi:hypothetical protein